MGSAVSSSDHQMSMNLRRFIFKRDIPNDREQFDLLVQLDGGLIFL